MGAAIFMSDEHLARLNVVADVDTSPADPLVAATVRFLYDLRDRLPMFIVCERPSDFPDHYTARLWLTLPSPVPILYVLRSASLEPLQETLEAFGLVHLSRSPGDDPCVLGSWV
jgi:hypothetical protein